MRTTVKPRSVRRASVSAAAVALSAFLASTAHAVDLGNITAIETGYGHTCALDAAGDVRCWGRNNEGQLGTGTRIDRRSAGARIDLGGPVLAIAAGTYHMCALTTARTVKCWGSNLGKQIGSGSAANYVLLPEDVTGLELGVHAISAGFNHSCAITAASTVKCWGTNDFGQLGDGTNAPRTSPVDVVALGGGIVAVSAGSGHTCALNVAGAVKCWGYNHRGQIGNGSLVGSLVPVDVPGLDSGVATITAGDGLTCATTVASGTVKCWGLSFARTPVDLPIGSGFVEVRLGKSGFASGNAQICVRAVSGTVVCAGSNDRGQLGINTGMPNVGLPIGMAVGLDGAAVAIAVGGYHACALLQTGNVRCWGSNERGELGDGNPLIQPIPVAVQGLSSAAATIAISSRHSCAVTTTGSAQCWGRNLSSELGSGPSFQSTTARVVDGLSSGVKAIASGGSMSCALTNTGVDCWGSGNGAAGDGGTGITRATATHVLGTSGDTVGVAAGGSHACALSAAGGVICWGANGFGQLGDGTRITRSTPALVAGLASGVVAIAAGSGHTCALLIHGALRCWGWNANGQLGDGTNANALIPLVILGGGVKAVAAGNAHTCIVATSGGVRCWGDNRSGQIGTGSREIMTAGDVALPEHAIGIAAGGERSCAVTASGGAQCWGAGIYGNLIADSRGIQRTPRDVIGLVDRISSISVSSNHFCAITVTSSVLCWGNNFYGEIGNGAAVFEGLPVRVILEPAPRAVEFHNALTDHYFISADDQEVFAVDNGAAGPGWARTGDSFITGGNVPVCRFFGSQSPGPNSHFFALEGFECLALRALQFAAGDPRRATIPSWNFEGYAFNAAAPVDGRCAPATRPVFRAYNRGDVRGIDSNHRITANTATIAQMVARGWIDEGVRMCVPM